MGCQNRMCQWNCPADVTADQFPIGFRWFNVIGLNVLVDFGRGNVVLKRHDLGGNTRNPEGRALDERNRALCVVHGTKHCHVAGLRRRVQFEFNPSLRTKVAQHGQMPDLVDNGGVQINRTAAV